MSGSTPWFPKHDKDFLIGQRVIYADREIVTCVKPSREYRISAPNCKGHQWVHCFDGVDMYVETLSLNCLPGGQL